MIRQTLLCVLLCLIISGCTTFSGSSHQHPKEGSVLDATTTYIALEQGGTELNPLLSWGSPVEAALISIPLKYVIKLGINSQINNPEIADRAVETAGIGAAGFNLAGILGANPYTALPVGIISGWMYWKYREGHEASISIYDNID